MTFFIVNKNGKISDTVISYFTSFMHLKAWEPAIDEAPRWSEETDTLEDANVIAVMTCNVIFQKYKYKDDNNFEPKEQFMAS